MSVAHPHDRFVRRSMKRREITEPLLHMHLPKDVLECLDLGSLNIQPSSYIDEKFRETQSDLVFSIAQRETGDRVCIYLLFEHKSATDLDLPWSLLKRSVQIMEDQRRETGKTPLVIPLTLYHGRTPWTGPRNLGDQINAPEALLRFAPNMEMLLVDLSIIPDETIETRGWLTLFLYVLKHIKDGNIPHLLTVLLPDILEIRRQKKGLSFLADFYRYILEAGDSEDLVEVVKTAVQSLPEEVSKDMKSMADVLREEGRELGREEGREEGMQLAIEANRKTMERAACELLKTGLVSSEIARIIGLDLTVVEQLKARLNTT